MKRRRSREDSTGTMVTDTRVNVTPETVIDERVSNADPRRTALLWLAGYLTLSGLALGFGGNTMLGMAHAAVAGAALLSASRASAARLAVLAGDLLPLLTFPLLYAEV